MSKSVRVIAIGDPHFKRNNAIQSIPFSRECVKVCKELHPDIIVVLGDTLNDFEKKDIPTEINALRFLLHLREIAFVYLLIGNHDICHKLDFMVEEHAFYAVKFWDGIHVVDTTTTDKINGLFFTFVPYVPDGRFMEALEFSENWRESSIIFAHQNFQGHRLSSRMSEDADGWDISLPPVVSGHIHLYENLPNNVLYIGTPYQQNFDDNSDNSISLFIVGDEGYKHQRVRLNGIMEKRKVHIQASQLEGYIIPQEYLVKLIVTGKYQELELAKQTIVHKEIKLLRNIGYSIEFKEIPEDLDINYECYIRPQITFKDELYERLSDEAREEFNLRFNR